MILNVVCNLSYNNLTKVPNKKILCGVVEKVVCGASSKWIISTLNTQITCFETLKMLKKMYQIIEITKKITRQKNNLF